MPKLLHVIVACAENRVIGRDGRMPWRIPEDMAFFHAQTAGQICIMGRVCFDTWPDATRDGRRSIVVTSQPLPATPDDASAALAVGSLASALAAAESLPGDLGHFHCGELPRPHTQKTCRYTCLSIIWLNFIIL